ASIRSESAARLATRSWRSSEDAGGSFDYVIKRRGQPETERDDRDGNQRHRADFPRALRGRRRVVVPRRAEIHPRHVDEETDENRHHTRNEQQSRPAPVGGERGAQRRELTL